MKLKLGIPTKTEEKIIEEPSGTGISKYSTASEKILLYRSLFCGREDIFARRWYSKTTEKSGYQPVCENEWVDGLCDKRKYKCSVCPNRKLSPITDEDIYKHLEGKDFYGRDVIPNGGFGNLIALPLQGQARKSDNSIFVDRNFKPFADQWAYLSSIQRISIQSIERIVDTSSKFDILGTLVDDSPDKPWETKQKIQLTNKDFPEKLELVRSNMIYSICF